MKIIKAEPCHTPKIMTIYENAVSYMRQNGNLNQWVNGYPGQALIEKDIKNGNCYVLIEKENILAVFCYFEGIEPTYINIFHGNWLNDEPYGTIHRIAVAENAHGSGAAEFCYNFCLEKVKNLRIDTHRDNIPMQKSLAKNGFAKCGIIYLESGDERIAFHKTI